MEDYVIIDMDQISWLPSFGSCMALGPPKGLVSAGAKKATIMGMAVALEGDEAEWESFPVPYIDGVFVTPGVGKAKITALASNQLTKVAKCEGKAVILKGMMFQAEFHVTSPAMQPTPAGPVPDPVAVKSGGQGQFVNANQTVKMA